MELKNNSESKKEKSLFEKILIAFVDLIGNTITTKIGLGILLFILGLICLFSPIEGEPNKPIGFIMVGFALMIIGILIIIRKITQSEE